jgi:multiple sugar transport system substrate-binding protein
MPAGPKGSNATVGWMRFYGLTTQAVADKTREANAVKLIEWFGGKAEGKYTFQKNLLNDLGSGFGVNSLFKDPDVISSVNAYTDIKMYESAQKFAKKKDTIAPWFGEWDEREWIFVSVCGIRKNKCRKCTYKICSSMDRFSQKVII